jgi:hypothetical protein
MARPPTRPLWATAVASFVAFALLTGLGVKLWQGRRARAALPPGGRLETHEAFVTALRSRPVDVRDVKAVFAHVFASLPAEVTVYPTENYFYYSFYAEGRLIRGNVRLDPEHRERGQVSFAYYAAMHRPARPEETEHLGGDKIFGPEDGLALEALGPLLYEVSYGGKAVRFRLNDLSQAPPPPGRLGPGESFVFRTFDESGFQFELVYVAALRQFHFVLDESAPPADELIALAPRLRLGRLSGFAFYEDPARPRKLLVGVDAELIKENSYYDGPFDQLADNFITGDGFRRMLEEAYPYARGRLTDRGAFKTFGPTPGVSGSRLALTPYLQYPSREALLAFVAACERGGPERLVACLTDDYKRQVPGPPEGATDAAP